MFQAHSSFVFFFFFKQKTAYEMRISDWSSDVCSSDLCLQAPHRRARAAGRRRATTNIGPTSRGGFPAGPISHVPFVLRFMPRRAGLTPPVYRQPRRAAQANPHADKNGRPARRERVVKHVNIMEVYGPLKKKKNNN